MNANYCQDLTHPARMALWGILAFINIRDTNQPIFPTREVLRGETMLGSLPTLYRALALLEQHGYIYREQSRRQSKIDYGQYSISRIWITEKTQTMLNLATSTATTQTAEKPSPTSTCSQQPSIILRDGLLIGKHTKGKQPIQEQPAPSASTQPPVPCNSDFVQKNKKQKFNIPPELHVLQTLGLSEIRICALMKQARQAGIPNTLESIVKTTWYRLEKLRSSALFAYLTTLIRQPKDWVSLANKKEQEQQQALQAQTEKQETTHKLRTLSKHYVGQMALHIDGRNLGVLFASGQALWLKHVEQGIEKLLPVNKSFIAAWLAGRISFTPSTVTA